MLGLHEQSSENGLQDKGEARDSDDGKGSPEKEGVPFPLPEQAAELEGMLAHSVEEFGCGEGKPCGVEDAGGDVQEGEDQQELQRIDDVAAELGGGDVEPEEEGGGEAQDGGASEDGVNADEESGGDAPGEFVRGGSHAQEGEDGKNGAAVDPWMARGSEGLGGSDEIGFGETHCLQNRLWRGEWRGLRLESAEDWMR